MQQPNIFFLGDVHGQFDHVFRAVDEHRPDAVIFLGDIEAPSPFLEILAPILDKAVVRFIHGNHDTDNARYYNYLFGGKAGQLNLDGRVETIAGVRIAGLGGIFRESIWMPYAEPRFQSYAEYVEALNGSRPTRERFTDSGLMSEKERRHRGSIFPDVFNQLSMQSADVLITHEAPSCHPNGFDILDTLGRYLGVRKAFHGHHHDRIDYQNQWRYLCFEAHGVPMRGITALDGSHVL